MEAFTAGLGGGLCTGVLQEGKCLTPLAADFGGKLQKGGVPKVLQEGKCLTPLAADFGGELQKGGVPKVSAMVPAFVESIMASVGSEADAGTAHKLARDVFGEFRVSTPYPPARAFCSCPWSMEHWLLLLPFQHWLLAGMTAHDQGQDL